MRKLHIFVMASALFLAACGGESGTPSGEEIRISELPQVHPQLITRVDSADTSFFQHLGYESVPRDDGSFIIYDRQSGILFHLDGQGRLISRLTRAGRGPGEVQDITSLVETPGGGLLIYDQRNKKVIRFTPELKYRDEFVPEPFAGGSMSAIYPGTTDSTYVVDFFTTEWATDPSKDMDMILAQYDPGERRYGDSVRTHAEVFAPYMIDGQARGGMFVPYAPTQLLRYRPETRSFYLHLTGSGEIAEINAAFDSLRTLPLHLPGEELSGADRDSLRAEESELQWETLKDELPDTKVPVEHMVLGAGGQIWLQLNYRGNTQRWLVLGSEGEPQYVAHLPKGAMLLHASGQNIAVRLDAVTLALYEASVNHREFR